MNNLLKETDLARVVVCWLKDYGWEVYQEVKIDACIADIVAIQNNIIWIIECKKSMGLKVIDQAIRWKSYAHYVSIATFPRIQNVYIIEDIIKWKEIGCLTVLNEVNEWIKPSLNRKAFTDVILKNIREEQKTFVDAGSTGGYYTPFKDTCNKIYKEVSHNPGITLNELILKIKHHYKTPESAKHCILSWAKEGIIKHIRVQKEDGKYKFYLS